MNEKIIPSYSQYLRSQFGERVRKISLDVGMNCPNRDGAVGKGGCTFCNNESFSPAFNKNKKTVTQQLQEGIGLVQKKIKVRKFLAYFQTYSNTYAPLNVLEKLYSEALAFPGVVGLCIGTRCDCVDDKILDYLKELSQETDITLEYGIESVFDATLRKINRGHDFGCITKAMEKTQKRSLKVCGHLMFGFPWETKQQRRGSVFIVKDLPLQFLKFHQLEIVKGTQMGREYSKKPFPLITPQNYLEEMAHFLSYLPSSIIVQRLCGSSCENLLLSPPWPWSHAQFKEELISYMEQRGLRQGIYSF